MKKYKIIKKWGLACFGAFLAILFSMPVMAADGQPELLTQKGQETNRINISLTNFQGKAIKGFSLELKVQGGNVAFSDDVQVNPVLDDKDSKVDFITKEDGKTATLVVTRNGQLPADTIDIGSVLMKGGNGEKYTIEAGPLKTVGVTRYQKTEYKTVPEDSQSDTEFVIEKTSETVPVTDIKLSDSNIELTDEIPEKTLTATVEPENASDKTVVWESKNRNIVSVSNDGHLSAAGPGQTEVTAKAGDKTAACTVVVKRKAGNVEIISDQDKMAVFSTLRAVGEGTGRYKWYRLNNVDKDELIPENVIAETNAYTLTKEDVGKYIAVVFEGDGYYYGTTGAITQTVITKAERTEIPDLSIESTKDNKIVVTAVDGAEYRLNEGEWQDSNTFSQLTGGAAYEVSIRYRETDEYFASQEATLKVELEKSNQSPLKFEAVEDQDYSPDGNTVTLSAVGGNTDIPVVYTLIKGQDTASLEGNTLTMRQAGEYIVEAFKAGNEQYNDVKANITITVRKAQMSLQKISLLLKDRVLFIDAPAAPTKVEWNGSVLTEIQKVDNKEQYMVNVPFVLDKNNVTLYFGDNYREVVFKDVQENNPAKPTDPDQEDQSQSGSDQQNNRVDGNQTVKGGSANPATGVITDPNAAAFITAGMLILMLAGLTVFKHKKLQ